MDHIVVRNANENNLKGVDAKIPKNKLTVITGLSGSGKSSLAFDTIYAEGQRRYMETMPSYARQFIGSLDRPDVESIDGLSPVISIEQKSTSWNPRSTVGTTTEIYDFLRLLYARTATAYSMNTGKPMVQYTEEKIIKKILEDFNSKKALILAPVVRGRKGHYRELFEQMLKKGYTMARVDGKVIDIVPGLKLDRYHIHDIEIVIDRIKIDNKKRNRLAASINLALKMGNDLLMVKTIEEDGIHIFSRKLMCADTGLAYEDPSPNTFSFNSPYGTCPNCEGMGKLTRADNDKIIPDPTKSINQVGILPLGEVRKNNSFIELKELAQTYSFTFDTPINEIPPEAINEILYGNQSKFEIKRKFDFYKLNRDGLINMLEGWYKDTSSLKIRNWAENFMSITTCPQCDGYRIKKQSQYFRLDNMHIGQLSELDLDSLHLWLKDYTKSLKGNTKLISEELLKEIDHRLTFLIQVGLNYLSLNRASNTLSGGESQRTRLATQIGSQLTGITYVMDEPSIGLHQRDNHKLINSLKELTKIGNTVIVVEHDKDIMLAADYLFDLGPGAGNNGGKIINEGNPKTFIKKNGITAEYLSNRIKIEKKTAYRKGNGHILKLKGASGHNLKNVDLKIPLGVFCCITGVSGSGKSTLINQTLYPILRRYFYNSTQNPLSYDRIEGIENLDKVVEIDQSPIGRSSRSNPATYTKLFSHIRKIFAELPESKIRGYKIGRFSFNVKGGRCEVCHGGGQKVLEMNFLPNVHVECDKCLGNRYNRETLEILYKGKSISDVLNMSVEVALEFFKNIPSIYRRLKTLNSVGLGYIKLGQPATTLSGGEAQRVKLSEELSKKSTGNTLYILDEPTTGLHFQDIQLLIDVLDRLVDKGNTVVVIEHNLDVVKVADYVVDLGPDGGKYGGEIVFSGQPKELIKKKNSHTAHYLKMEMS